MYSLHPPSVTVNCVSCYRNDHCNFTPEFFVRLMPHMNRRFTDFSGFPVRSVSSPSSRWCLKKGCPPGCLPLPPTRRSFATNFGSMLYPLLSWGGAMQTALSWNQVDASLASYRNQQSFNGSTSCHGVHQFLLLWQYECGLRLQADPSQGSLLQSDPCRSQSFWTIDHG